VEINSSTYWEGRFSTDWKSNSGPEQSKMFAEVAVAMLPEWLRSDVRGSSMRVVDVGCAEGDALPVLADYFGADVQLSGTDFSEKAIDSAREKYPSFKFEVADASQMETDCVDVVFCSNVLEHFHEPLSVLQVLANAAKNFVVIVVPFWEFKRDIEHFVTFDSSSFPVAIGGMTLAYWNVADVSRIPNTYWLGYQAVLVYASPGAVERNKVSMQDLVRSSFFPGLTVADLLQAAKNDSSLHRALQIGSVAPQGAAEGSEEYGDVQLRLAGISDRQEAIGHALHEQVKELGESLSEIGDGQSSLSSVQTELEKSLGDVGARQEKIAADLLEHVAAISGRISDIDARQLAQSTHLEKCIASINLSSTNLDMLGGQLAKLTAVMDAVVTKQKLLDATLEQHHDLIGGRVDVALDLVSERFSLFNSSVQEVLAELRGTTSHSVLGDKVWSLKDVVFSMEGKLDQQGVAIDRHGAALEDLSKFGMEIEIMEKEKSGMANSIGSLEAKLAELEARCVASEAGRRVAEAKLRSIESSRSWRITAPLRSLMTKLKGRENTVVGAFESPAGAGVSTAVSESPKQDYQAQLESILVKHAGRKIIVFRPLVDWDLPLFQRPHHIAARLARQGFLYFYCTPNMYDGLDGFKEIEEGLYLTNQFDLVSGLYTDKIVHLYSTDNHCSLDYVRGQQAGPARIIYEYIDEIDPTISGVEIPQHVWDKHNALIEDRSVICIASADKLFDEVRVKRSENIALVTNGVEFEHFNAEVNAPVPADIADWVQAGKPIIGYFGALATWFDYDLVEKCAARYPECNFLLLGWDYDGTLAKSNFASLPNVRVVGPIPYKQLPEYARFFDVSTIPFKINAVTESTSPIKLFEYMSMGKPIVTTDMPECRKYKSVMIGRTHDEYVDLIHAALERRSDVEYKDLLRDEALANTWDAKAKVISELLA